MDFVVKARFPPNRRASDLLLIFCMTLPLCCLDCLVASSLLSLMSLRRNVPTAAAIAPAGKRRSGGEIDSDMNIMLCSGCSFNLSASGYAQLCDGQGDVAIGCSHILCTMCFGRAHAERGSDVKLQCRRAHCAYRTMTWIIFTPMTNNRSGDITRWSQEEQSIELPSSSKRHPNVFFQHQEDWFRKVHTIFSAVTTDESSPGNFT